MKGTRLDLIFYRKVPDNSKAKLLCSASECICNGYASTMKDPFSDKC